MGLFDRNRERRKEKQEKRKQEKAEKKVEGEAKDRLVDMIYNFLIAAWKKLKFK